MRAWILAALAATAAGAQESKPGPQCSGGVDQPGGTVAGIVKFSGKLPKRPPIAEVAGNAFCKECHKETLPLSERWVFGKNGEQDTVANVLVHVSKGLEGRTFEPPKTPVVLDQVGCIYTPHVVGVMAGQTLEVRNSDGTLHNVMCTPRNNKGFNEGMSVKGGKLEKVFANPEFKLDLRCFMHPWMLAYAHVMSHPYYAVTGTDGAFAIRGLPPGEYEITVLHETSRMIAEPATLKVKVEAGQTTKADFSYRFGAEE
jgi:plastocyanin